MRVGELFAALKGPLVERRVLFLGPTIAGSIFLLSGIAAADTLPQSSVADTAAGIASGLILTVLVLYGLFLALAPIARSHSNEVKRAALFLAALLVIKTSALLLFHGFTIDVGTYEAWGLQMAHGGPASMYRSGFFLDYPPGYLYALWAVGALAQAVGASGDLLRMIIGAPPQLADFAIALLIFSLGWRLADNEISFADSGFLSRESERADAAGSRGPAEPPPRPTPGKSQIGAVSAWSAKNAAWLGMLLFALNPALLFDTVVWVQTDSALTLVMLLSVVMLLDDEIELGWGLAALAVLIKPQALSLLPVLTVWTFLKARWQRWLRSGLAFVAALVVATAPFQVGHRWSWLPDLYLSTAAYYHETSVNAFNFMALLGGLRQSDAGTLFGLSYFSIGIALLAPLYAFAIWLIARKPLRRNLLCAAFIAVFGFFLFAPRMHERYLYPAVVFAIPLVFEAPALLIPFGLLSLTCFCNLAEVLHALNSDNFLDARDLLGMGLGLVNLFTFVLAARYAIDAGDETPASDFIGALRAVPFPRFLRAVGAPRIGLDPQSPALQWMTRDTVILTVLVASAALLRFWNLGHPSEIVFDEVHFVGQARHYIHNEPFLDPHPPLAKLLIAAGILLFGDHPWSWRLANATLGTAMVAVTFLLGRRMFHSRLAAALAAVLVACDGFFIVDSRIGCIDIVYLTFAAIAYLLLFEFMENPEFKSRRRLLLITGVVLGLCLGSKLYVPAITFLLEGGFILFALWKSADAAPDETVDDPEWNERRSRIRVQRLAGAAMIVGSLGAIFYLASFLPHYALGWWGGIADLVHYYKDVMWYENSVATATHPYASPWWSWPLMLRPVAYWQDFPPHGDVATIWGAGNPLTWWAVVPAMTITGVRAMERPNTARIFLVTGFLAYYLIWVPIGRILFLYHYLPSVYIGYLALAAVLADLWNETAEDWEAVALLFTIAPVLLVGGGHIATEYQLVSPNTQMMPGLVAEVVLVLIFLVLRVRGAHSTRFVFVAFLTTAAILFVYYLPIWLGMSITRTGYYARMWLQGPGLRNWI